MIRKVSVLIATLAVLSGCAMTQQAGAAAIVGDQRLMNEQINKDYEAIMTNLGDQESPGTAAELNRRLISSFVYSITSTKVAEQLGVAATDADVEAKYQELLKSFNDEKLLINAAAAAAIPSYKIHSALRTNLNFSAIGLKLKPNGTADEQSAAAILEMRKVGLDLAISVSPRFGTWDFETFALVDDTSTSVTYEQMFPTVAAAQ